MAASRVATTSRWSLLRRAIHGNGVPATSVDGASKRAGAPTFALFADVAVLDGSGEADGDVRKAYTVIAQGPAIIVRELAPRASFRDSFSRYSGFLNTGNICVWPAEQILAVYIARHPDIVRGKRVLEVGAGMTGMAALAAAIHGKPASVYITDGHPDCVTNIAAGIALNNATVSCPVEAKQLLWSVEADYAAFACDLVLLADCFFVTDVHAALVHLLVSVLARGTGRALGLAPQRGGSLDRFVAAARASGLAVTVDAAYDTSLRGQHDDLLRTAAPNYDPDTHYPLLVDISVA